MIRLPPLFVLLLVTLGWCAEASACTFCAPGCAEAEPLHHYICQIYAVSYDNQLYVNWPDEEWAQAALEAADRSAVERFESRGESFRPAVQAESPVARGLTLAILGLIDHQRSAELTSSRPSREDSITALREALRLVEDGGVGDLLDSLPPPEPPPSALRPFDLEVTTPLVLADLKPGESRSSFPFVVWIGGFTLAWLLAGLLVYKLWMWWQGF